MGKNMAIGLAKHHIRVNIICPGWIQTPLVGDWFGQNEDEQTAIFLGSTRWAVSERLKIEGRLRCTLAATIRTL